MNKYIHAIPVMAILLLSHLAAFSQGVLKGTVKDEKGEPVGNVSIGVTGTKTGTSTDASGAYQLSLPAGSHKIVLSSIGYNNTSFSVKFKAAMCSLFNQIRINESLFSSKVIK